MNRLMAIFAHPDDEGAIAGTLARYVQEGSQVTLVCATKGEAGEISDSTLATPDNLGSVREDVLRTTSRPAATRPRPLNWRAIHKPILRPGPPGSPPGYSMPSCY